jgi:hypothetical protein
VVTGRPAKIRSSCALSGHEVPLRREGKFWVYRGGEAPAPVDVAGMIAAEREARSESILPGSTALPSMQEGAEP